MRKHLIILIIYMVCVSGCAQNWSIEEQQRFLDDCQASRGTKSICECVLGCLEGSYENYNLLLENIEKSEISKSLERCLKLCQE